MWLDFAKEGFTISCVMNTFIYGIVCTLTLGLCCVNSAVYANEGAETSTKRSKIVDREPTGQSKKHVAKKATDEVSTAEANSGTAKENADESATSEKPQAVRIIESLKKDSGKPNLDAKAFVFLVYTEHHISNICGIYMPENAKETLKLSAKGYKDGAAKHLKRLKKIKGLSYIYCVEESADMKVFKKYIPKWLGLKAPIVTWPEHDVHFTEIADCDGIIVTDREAHPIARGSLEINPEVQTVDRVVEKVKEWKGDNGDE